MKAQTSKTQEAGKTAPQVLSREQLRNVTGGGISGGGAGRPSGGGSDKRANGRGGARAG